MLLCTSPEVVTLTARACDEQELSWCQLGYGHLSKDSPSGRQHVADVGHAHLKTKKGGIFFFLKAFNYKAGCLLENKNCI